ncbi:MAG TPA: 4'-phosphopantetheinyl transferase superfamily protein [Flavobacterium sp.]|uniref:4'-phosphopantetheinyl transferase family protein n=1 Tax=Flavobacterium sp. TaxID=239 RepID=UPI002ED5A30F
MSEENHERLLENNLSEFSVDFQNKIRRYKRWQDAQLSLLGRVLLFMGVEEIFGNSPKDRMIKNTKYNKPYFESNLVKFNISHSGEIVVCALCDKDEVGIDIEKISDIEINNFKLQMTKKEWKNIIFSYDKKEAFFDYWTQKESVIKAHGHGLTIPLTSFEIFENTTEINDEKYILKEIKINEKYKCYISSKRDIGEICLKEIKIQFNQLNKKI